MEKAFEPYVDGSTNTVIKVVGVGGAGGNALNTMVTKLTDCQVEFIAAKHGQASSDSLSRFKKRFLSAERGLAPELVRKSVSKLLMTPGKRLPRNFAAPTWSSLRPVWGAVQVPVLPP